jgi:S-DNA-T family DNA segregation ATPase FtsK/SpoIIIE
MTDTTVVQLFKDTQPEQDTAAIAAAVTEALATPDILIPVDNPKTAVDTGTWLGQRRAYLADAPPVIPSWLRNAAEFAEGVRWGASYYSHMSAFHTVRTPVYVLRLVRRGPRGAWRLTVRWVKWPT